MRQAAEKAPRPKGCVPIAEHGGRGKLAAGLGPAVVNAVALRGGR